MAFISYPNFQVFDDNGDPLSEGKVYTYDAGTVNAKTTYSDNAMSVANSNPVILDSRGECDIYCSGTLKLVIKTSDGVTVITQDNFSGRDDSLLQDGDGDTLIQVEESDDEDIIRFDCGGTEQITIQDGKIEPTTDDDIDLGSVGNKFKDIYIDGVAYLDSLIMTGNDPILFDGTAGRVLRISKLRISDGTDVAHIKCDLVSITNGDAITSTDNIDKDETVGNFTLDAAGDTITIEAAGLAGNCVAVLAANISLNASGNQLDVNYYVSSNDITLDFLRGSTGAAEDMTTAVDTGNVQVIITYLTSA